MYSSKWAELVPFELFFLCPSRLRAPDPQPAAHPGADAAEVGEWGPERLETDVQGKKPPADTPGASYGVSFIFNHKPKGALPWKSHCALRDGFVHQRPGRAR